MQGKSTDIKTGEKIGMCTLLSFAPIDRTKKSRAKRGVFLCDCGTEFITTLEIVKKGKTKSCGCYNRQVNRDRKIEYVTGQLIGNLTYLNDVDSESGDRKAKFKCVCGEEFITKIQSVKQGATKSCGCLTSKLLSEAGKLRDNSGIARVKEAKTYQEIPEMSEQDKHRFWTKVGFTAIADRCWDWQGGTRARGYGRFNLTISAQKDISLVAPRVAYFLHYGVQPLDKNVAHTCDLPSCCNPAHLFLATSKENTDDMMNKGRGVQPKGEQHGRSKLTEDMVRSIRQENLDGAKNKDLAVKYNVNTSAISLIVTHKTWTHIL